MKKFKYIDSLRGIAIIGVVVLHVVGGETFRPKIDLAVSLGAKGVQLFFMASAFTLFLSFHNRAPHEKMPVRNFLIRRFFRIAPMYYLGIIYYIFQNGLGPKYETGRELGITTLNIVSNFLFIHGVHPYWINSLVPGGWSITVEMTFYLLFPIIFRLIKNLDAAFRFLIVTLLIRLAINLLLAYHPLIKQHDLWSDFLYFYFINQLPVFAIGILMYFFIFREKHQDKGLSYLSFFVMSFLFVILIFPTFGPVLGRLEFSNNILICVAFFCLGVGLSKKEIKILVNPVITHIGKVSFSIYLIHFAVIHWLNTFHLMNYSDHLLVNYPIRILVVLALSTGIATLTYNLIEVPMQNLGKRIISKLESSRKVVD